MFQVLHAVTYELLYAAAVKRMPKTRCKPLQKHILQRVNTSLSCFLAYVLEALSITNRCTGSRWTRVLGGTSGDRPRHRWATRLGASRSSWTYWVWLDEGVEGGTFARRGRRRAARQGTPFLRVAVRQPTFPAGFSPNLTYADTFIQTTVRNRRLTL